MIKEFNTYLEKVDTHYWNNLCKEMGTLRKFKADEEIIPLDMVGQFLGLIKSGTVKYAACTSEGEEKIIGLEAADGFAASWPFCLRDIPSLVSIIAITDCEIYCLPISFIREKGLTDNDFERKIEHATEQLFHTAYDRLVDLYILSPKERYEKMLQLCPQIFELFTFKDIASFLNISTQHLFRIRKGLE